MKNLKQILKAREKLREESPLIHAITNPIAINMVANAILFLGAKAICAVHPEEVRKITSISSSLSVNLGNITSERMKAIELAANTANKKDIPLAIDMVGVGSSTLRYNFANTLLDTNSFDLIKGNSSEIRALALGKSQAKGIDVGEADKIKKENIGKIAEEARALAKKHKSTIIITGKTDLIVGSDSYIIVDNGVENLSKITGTGCMLTGIISSFMAVEDPVSASILGLLILEIAAEISDTDRLYTFFVNLMDEIGTIKDDDLIKAAKLKEIQFWKNFT